MVNRVLAVAVFTAATLAVPRAADDVGYVLVSGERVRGVEVSMSAPGPETPNGEMNLQLSNGEERNFDRLQVAIIEYVTGHPSQAELNALPHDPNEGMVALRDGNFLHGRMVDLRPEFLRWQATGGGTENIPIGRLSRVYLNAAKAREIFNAPQPGQPATAPPPGTPAAWRGNEAGPFNVPGSEHWTDSGLTVRRGDWLQFSASGEVHIAPNRPAPPGGTGAPTRNVRLPVPRLPLGGLIAKIGDNQPFAIGSSSEAIQIRDNGRLWFGINDDVVTDNSGAFVVTVRRIRR